MTKKKRRFYSTREKRPRQKVTVALRRQALAYVRKSMRAWKMGRSATVERIVEEHKEMTSEQE